MQNFLRWDRGLVDKVLSGELSFMEYAYLNWISCRANPYTGILLSNYSTIAKEIRERVDKVKYGLDKLKEKGYINFNFKQGQRLYSEITINNFPCGKNSEVVGKTRVKHINFSEVTPEVKFNNANGFSDTKEKSLEVTLKNRSNFKNFSEVVPVNPLKSTVSDTSNIEIDKDIDNNIEKKSDKSDYEIIELARSLKKIGYSKDDIVTKLNKKFRISVKKIEELKDSFFKE